MSNFLEFTCTGCGRTNLVDPAEIPEKGGVRACQGCGARMFVSPAGIVEPVASEEPAPRESGLGVSVRMATGKTEILSASAVEQGIQSRYILPWDLVSDDGQDFHPIMEHADFQGLFIKSDFTPTIQRRCVNHDDALPAGTCRRCGRSYCKACVDTLMKIRPRLCPACGGPVNDPDPRLAERPVWERWQELLRFPIDGAAWKVTLAAGVVFWLASRTIFASPLYLLVLPLFVFVVSISANGAKSFPARPEVDFRQLLEQVIPVAILTVVAVLPFAAAHWLLPPALTVLLYFPLALAVAVLFPMAVGIAVLSDDKQKAFDPKAIGMAIWALREGYLVLLLLLIAAGVVVLAAQVLLSFIPLLSSPLNSIAGAYGNILQAHLLGWALWMNRERILAAIR
jgi:DNA-directed RNA polymerase subunit RPC12/RpoP